MGVASRLREAIKDSKFGSIRQFQKAIHPVAQEREVRGSSYSMVHQYLQGEATPPLEFVEIAGEVLSVRPAWLAFGEGRRTEVEEVIAGGDTQEEFEDLVVDFVAERAPYLYRAGSTLVVEVFRLTLNRLLVSCAGSQVVTEEEVLRAAEGLAIMVQTPAIQLIGADDDQQADRGFLEDYFIAALHAVMLAIPDRNEGRPLNELLESIDSPEEAPSLEEQQPDHD